MSSGGVNTFTLSSALTATALLNGASVSRTVTRAGQDVRVTVDASAGDWLNISLVSINATTYADVEVLQPNGATFASTTLFSWSPSDFDTVALPASGSYTVRIDPYALSSGTYSVTVSTPVTGVLGVNAGSTAVTITRPAQDGWLTFNGVAGQSLTLTTVAPSGKPTDLYVYTPSGAQLISDYAYGTSNLKLPTLSSTGVYSVRIDPWSSYTGVYTLSLSAPVAQGGAKVLAKAESPKPAQQGGTAWQQLIAQLNNDAAQSGNRVEVTKYYAFGGARIAMRQAGNEVFYLAGDHLGSASLVVDWQGRKISEMRYTPWGETRWAWELDGEGYTSRLYTSQLRQSASYVGQLYDYGARFYNPTTARFVSADTLVQAPNDPIAFNRYAFTRNNPIRYIDPSGHFWQKALEWLGETLLGAAVGGLVGVAGEATTQVINASKNGKSLSVAVQEFSLPENTARLIGAGVGGSINGAILAGSKGKGGIVSFAAGGVAGGQAEALARGMIEEKQTAGDHFDLSNGVERAAQYGFLDFGTVVKDGVSAVIAGKIVEFAGKAIDRYMGGQISKEVKQIEGFDPVTKKVIVRVVSRSQPKPLSPLQRAAVIATKRVVDWAGETLVRYLQPR